MALSRLIIIAVKPLYQKVNDFREMRKWMIRETLFECKRICADICFNSILIIHTNIFKVGGLQLEGCTFDGAVLVENQRDSPSVSAVPPCTIAWITKVMMTLSPISLRGEMI